jgi:hypothetical protein
VRLERAGVEVTIDIRCYKPNTVSLLNVEFMDTVQSEYSRSALRETAQVTLLIVSE